MTQRQPEKRKQRFQAAFLQLFCLREKRMSYELYLFTEPKCWIRDNFAVLTSFFAQLDSFEQQSDDVYLLVREDWNRRFMPDVVFRFNHVSCETMMEINTYPLPIENDLLKLFAEIKKHTTLVIQDEDGEQSNWNLCS